jgi:membrane associated rhomboid family serine protease
VFIETPVTLILLLANGLVGAYTLFVDPSLVGRLAFRPHGFWHGREYGRALTAGFVHAGMGHLAVNLLTLYFFGPYVERLLGPVGFLAVYFGSEVAANVATLVRHRHDPGYSAVGASGAISGVLFSFCLFAPLQMLYLFFALPIPAILFAVLYVAYSVYASRQQADRVAHEAHLGGALGGVLITLLVRPDALMIFLRQLGL